MAGFGDIFTPIHNWVDPRRNALAGLGAGLLQGRPGAGVQEGIQADTAYAVMQKAEDERARNLNQTVEWARKTYPDQLANIPDNLVGDMAVNLWKQQFMPADAGSSMPANIREWEYYNALTPEQQGEYIRMKRANPYLDLGTGFGQPDPINPGSLAGPVIPKNGDIPTGFEQNPAGGGIAPMPGSPQETELNAGKVKAATAINTLEQKNQIAVGAIDKALTNATFWTTGMLGSLSSALPGTPAYDLARTLDTIKANIGFEELQTMRDNSPTGGALGQVTERELAFLQSTIANIEQAQSEPQLRENLRVLKQYLSMSGQQRRAAFEQQYGGGAPAGQSTSTGVQWSYEP